MFNWNGKKKKKGPSGTNIEDDEKGIFASGSSQPTVEVPPPEDPANPDKPGRKETKLHWRHDPVDTSKPQQPGPPQVGGEDNPVVGWLVIIKGPGRGYALPLGYGMNDLGRHPEQRVPLTFGDMGVSEFKHSRVTYDPRSRRYYLQHGDSKNLTYLAGESILAPVELKGGEHIELGSTRLRFVPLCGQDFDWQDEQV